ncbi:MAG TPA: hypothetical protein VML50_15170 [Anaeromyxobacter sp.]|nr:hypothetical protein [Anaeromyxobacter sp.]
MNPIESIHVAPTTEQRAEPGRFSAALKGAASGLAAGVASSVALAAPYVPAGNVLSAAVRSATAGAVSGAAAGAASPGGSAVAAAPGSASGGGDLLAATRALQQESQAFNLQYLQLQESMQRESREFTALTNVMKVRHDSAKAAIQNIH